MLFLCRPCEVMQHGLCSSTACSHSGTQGHFLHGMGARFLLILSACLDILTRLGLTGLQPGLKRRKMELQLPAQARDEVQGWMAGKWHRLWALA